MLKKKSTQKHARQKKENSFFLSVFWGTLLSLFFGLLMLALSCFGALQMEDPERVTPVFALISLFTTAFFGGYIAARTHRENGLLCGLLSGIFLIGILVLLAFSFSLTIRPSLFLICAPAAIVISAVSGVCGVSGGTAKKKKHPKRF